MTRIKMQEHIQAVHRREYGADPVAIAYAPGRVEVLGNHTDYNEGTVLSAAIDLGTVFAVSPSDGPTTKIFADNLVEHAEFIPGDATPHASILWARYAQGVMFYLKQAGIDPGPVNCSFYGTVPMGSGLSSSAALEVSTAFAMCQLAGEWPDMIALAKICQASEHNFAGSMTGLLDQFSSIFGKDQSLIHSDFRTLKADTVSMPDDIRFILFTPEIRHSLADSPYNARRSSCETAATELGKLIGADSGKLVSALRDVSPAEFEKFRSSIPEEAAQRAAHIIGEIDRVEKGSGLLALGDDESFGNLMFDSHESSRLNFENSVEELDQVVAAAKAAGALGARLSGGGWGGSLIAMVHQKDAERIAVDVEDSCRALGLGISSRLMAASAGAEILA